MSKPRPPKTVPIAVAVLAALALLLLGVGLTIALGGPHRWGAGPYARDFFKSSGFAGIAALTAAGIAYLSIGRQVRVSEDALNYERTKTDTESWWQRFEWIAAEATASSSDHATIPSGVLGDMLGALQKSATEETQRAACVGLLAHLSQHRGQHDAPRASPRRSAADDRSFLESVQRFVASTPESSPQSFRARAVLYEQEVLAALRRLESQGLRVDTSFASDRNFDALVTLDSKSTGVEIKLWTERTSRSSIEQTLRRLSGGRSYRIPILIVAPTAVSLMPASSNIGVVKWDGPHDDAALLAALQGGFTEV